MGRRRLVLSGALGVLPVVSLLGILSCQGPVHVSGDDGDAKAAANCPTLAAGTDEQSVRAYDRVNTYRREVGSSCINFVQTVATASAAHCAYYVANHGSCVANPHREVSTCAKFVAERFGDRMKHAAYTGSPAYEDMTYVGNGAQAVDEWVDSIWHRIPVLSPYVGDIGYGMAGQCDTMDFGWAPTGPAATAATVVYPYDQQKGVPTSFDGDLESPSPPRPPRGWPSGYPIIAFTSVMNIHSHQLFDDKGAEVDHTFIEPGDDDSNGILVNEVVMYALRPLKNQTAYRVVIDGTRQGGSAHLDWTFTTE